jgi:hypothetical protein
MLIYLIDDFARLREAPRYASGPWSWQQAPAKRAAQLAAQLAAQPPAGLAPQRPLGAVWFAGI